MANFRLAAILMSAILLFCSCNSRDKQVEIPSVLDPSGKPKLDAAIAELQRLYQAANSEQERRAICLRAIDEGKVYRGAPVSNLDQMFGTKFASALPTKGTTKPGIVLFAIQPTVSPRPDGLAEAIGYVGSYLAVDYDHDGNVQYYYISNLHKGMSARAAGKEPVSIVELKQRYDRAASEAERREITLLAIDEGVIQTFGPVRVSTVDAVFNTHLASALPTRKEQKRTGIVDFSSPSGTAPGNQQTGWFLAVEYYSDGCIANYYLTNIPIANVGSTRL